MKRLAFALLLLTALASVLLLTGSHTQASPATYTVNSTADPGDGTCDGTECTLREAIAAANANAGTDTIEFNIPGAGPHIISPGSALPTITDPVTIDGYTQPGASPNTNPPELGTNAVLKIELDGSGAGSGADGLSITAGSSTVRGLVINRFGFDGIELSWIGGNTVEGNYIWVNDHAGVDINGAPNNTIGGTAAGARNVISGNGRDGVSFEYSGATGNLVQGNLIGTDVTGTAALPNQWDGVVIYHESGNTIGGASAGERNVISGNAGRGIDLRTSSNRVIGNYIGTDVTGTAALPNQWDGVHVWSGAQNNTIGGSGAGQGNVISGNAGRGIDLTSSGNRVIGNYIGTNAAGDAALPNQGYGVHVWAWAESTTIGGSGAGEGNVISGNADDGVVIESSDATGNQVIGNYIGTNAAGDAALPNQGYGVRVWGAPGNTIGGSGAGERNVISGNKYSGVAIYGSGNTVEGNYIGSNAAGDAALPNENYGVYVGGGAQNNTIGGSTEGERNVISGNNYWGVGIRGSGTNGNTVKGNHIGTNAAGDAAVPNQNGGVDVGVGAQNNTIGGSMPGEGNVISGNSTFGVIIFGNDPASPDATSGNTVIGNYIGTNAAGDAALPNQWDGVFIAEGAQDNTIGGSSAGERNVISGNGFWGVEIYANSLEPVTSGNRVIGNYIGTNAAGDAAVPNQWDGVRLYGHEGGNVQNNTIGGTTADEGNVIAYNAANGVLVKGTATTGNTISSNSIHSNGDRGIKLLSGGNTELAPPIIDSVGSASGHTDPKCYPCTVEVFSDDEDEGRIYHGSTTTNDDATGTWTYPGPVTGPNITATITDGDGNTSEFSLPFAYEPERCGDVDCDDDVDAVDALFILQYVVGLRSASDQCPPPEGHLYLPAGDVDCDDDVDAVDALFVLQHVVGLRPELCVCGITPTEIIIGTHSPLSGLYAAVYSMIPQAQEAYYKYVNDTQGGVCGRQIVLKVEDDGYDPAQALEVTKKLVEQDKVFAIVGAVGDLPHSGVWEYLNDKGIPDILVSAGAHKYGADPQGHPWTVQMMLDYTTEGTFFGQYISQNLPDKKVAILYENSDFGWDGLAGVKDGLDPDKNEIVSEQSFEITAVSIASQVTNMKDAGAEVVVLYSTPGFTAQAVKQADHLGWHPQWFMNYINSDEIIFQFVSPELLEGVISFQAVKLADWTDDPAIARHHEIMDQYGGPTPSNFSIYAQSLAELSVEIFSRTCDNLTREGLMEALESIEDFQSDPLLPGVNVSFSETDHTGLQTGRMLRATLVDGEGKWEYFGPLVSLEQP